MSFLPKLPLSLLSFSNATVLMILIHNVLGYLKFLILFSQRLFFLMDTLFFNYLLLRNQHIIV